MFAKPSTTAAVPSRGALRVLRQLALAGSTIGAIGGVCTVATITYDVHRRVHLAERIVQNKRNLQVSCPNYDSTGGAVTVAKMMEAAEAGEFMGLDSMRDRRKRRRPKGAEETRRGPEKAGVGQPVESDLGKNSSSISAGSSLLGNPASHGEVYSQQTSSDQNLREPLKPTPAPPRKPKTYLPPETNHPGATIASKFRLRYQDARNMPPLVKIQKLLDQNKPIQAAQLFMEVHPASITEGISAERRQLAVKIFYANIKAENVFLARNVFNRIDAIDKVTPALWEVLILALGKRGSVESVATLYIAYSRDFVLSPTLLDLVLRSLIDSYNLKDAKRLIYKHLDQDRGCGLCGIYLNGLWKKTRSIELLVTQFEKLLSKVLASGARPTEKLFNPLLRAYIDVGREEDARALAESMETEYKIRLRARTRGLFVYAKALRCDWDGVEGGLQELHKLGLSTKQPSDFAKIFDRIFLEFWLANSGPAIRSFVFRAIDKCKLVPDQVLFNHIVEAFVEKGDSEMVTELMTTVEKHSWKVSLNKESFMEMVRRRRLACEVSPVGLWQMFRASQEKFGQAATSQRILGYDRTSFPDSEAYKMPWTHEPATWWRRAMSMSEPSKGVNQFVSLHKQMIHCMQTGKWSDALRIYTSAKYAGKVMKQVHVELAVTASIMHKGFTDEAKIILEDDIDSVRNFGKPVMPLFFQQVLQASEVGEVAALKMAVFNFYRILERRLLPCKHHVAVAAGTQLIAKDDHQAAVDLLTAVYKSRYGLTVKFDGVAMKLLVRAFGGVGNQAGIRWGIYTALKRPSALNRDLVVEVHRTIAALWSRPMLRANQTENLFYTELDQLSDLAELLTKASAREGSSNSADLSCSVNSNDEGSQQTISDFLPTSNTRVQPRGQRKLGKGDKRSNENEVKDVWRSPNHVNKILENWDEELELEKALRQTKSLPAGDIEDWSEDRVWDEQANEF